MAPIHNIVAEPAGSTYLSLLAFAERRSSHFSLVWQHQLSFDNEAEAVQMALRPYLLEQTVTAEWPGTTLFGHLATVRMYRVCPDSIRELSRAGRLFAWESPERPEDLAFYAGDSGAWLGSIAHEREAFVMLEPTDLATLQAAVPGLQLRPAEHAG